MADKPNQATGQEPKAQTASAPSLDHGVPSLVAQDNPDDSQLGAPKTEPKSGKKA